MVSITPHKAHTCLRHQHHHTDIALRAETTQCAVFRRPLHPEILSKLIHSLTHSRNTLVLDANKTGLGEARATKTGTMGWAPPENVVGAVLAAPDQDTFAVGVDICFLVAHATLKLDYVSMFGNKVRGMPVLWRGRRSGCEAGEAAAHSNKGGGAHDAKLAVFPQKMACRLSCTSRYFHTLLPLQRQSVSQPNQQKP